MKRRVGAVISICLIISIVLGILGLFSNNAYAAERENDKRRAVFVVFDNSGSMYAAGDGSQVNYAWSQATYAMELFASMMNFDNGDVMQVYPMHPVKTDGPGGSNEVTDFSVVSKADIDKIHNMFTLDPYNTPYTPVTKAAGDLYEYLSYGGADEGWLVVLTDGSFDSGLPQGAIPDDLKAIASTMDNLYVQYLGMGPEANVPTENNDKVGYYSTKVNASNEVISKLAEICNRIFKRTAIENYRSGDSLSFDIPIKAIFVFAQGENVAINTLKSKEGTEVPVLESRQIKYSETGGSNLGREGYIKNPPKPDTSLGGVVSTFSYGSNQSINAGDYSLDVSGTDQISVYYEPDVTFSVQLFDGDTRLTAEDSIGKGSYTLKAGFLDRMSGTFIDGSVLLGDDTEYTIEVNGVPETLSSSHGAPVETQVVLDPGLAEISASVRYLENYSDNYSVEYNISMGSLEIKLDRDSDSTDLTALENMDPFVATIYLEGARITDEMWNSMALPQVSAGQMDFEVEKGPDSSTFMIWPKWLEGDYLKTATGETIFKVSASVDTENETLSATATGTIDIFDDFHALTVNMSAPAEIKLKSIPDGEKYVEIDVIHYDGRELSDEEWNALDVQVSCMDDVNWRLEKDQSAHVFKAYPEYVNDDMYQTATGDITLRAEASAVIEGEKCSGKAEQALTIVDDKNIIDFVKKNWKWILLGIILLVIGIGYIPGIKKYLSRRLVQRPLIKFKPLGIGTVKYPDAKGSCKKDTVRLFAPYLPQRAKIVFSKTPAQSKAIQVESMTGHGEKMRVLNAEAFRNKRNIKFDGSYYDGSAKKLIISDRTEITLEDVGNKVKASCTVNDGASVKNKKKKK